MTRMNATFPVIIMILFFSGLQSLSQVNRQANDNLEILVLYNDLSAGDPVLPGYGFSCLVQNVHEACLFDAGKNPVTLISNAERLGVDYEKIKSVFISHIHDDHMGGLHGILEKLNKPDLHMPYSYPVLANEPPSDRAGSDWMALLDSYKPKVTRLVRGREPTKIGNLGYSTGAIESVFFEQSLVIPTSGGLVILTGCSHPGIVETVKHAREQMNDEVCLVIGGFHMVSAGREQATLVAQELRKLTRYIAPCHCTGVQATSIFKEVFRNDFLDVRAGQKVRIRDGKLRYEQAMTDQGKTNR